MTTATTKIKNKSTAEVIELAARKSIVDHFTPRINHAGRDITHHEPVVRVEVSMSLRFAKMLLQNKDRPTEIDGVPVVYVERPAPGRWDVSTMCVYVHEGSNKERRSRGRLAGGNIDELHL